MSPESQPIAPRIAAIAPSATLAVTSKAKALKAAGAQVIGFGAGEPDFPTPPHIVEAAVAACQDPKNHRYSPAGGLPELKDSLVAKTLRDSGYEVGTDQIVVTNGGKQAVYNTAMTLFGDGDEVLLPAPYWTTYPEPIRVAGAKPVVIPTNRETEFRVTVAQLEAARTPATKALLFCSPSNPTGGVYPREEIEAIGQWALEHGIWVVTDEIYEHLVYAPHEHHSMPVVVPDLADQCVVLNGVAKTYAMTGWRVGWIIAPPAIAKAATNLQSHQTSNVCNVAQAAALAAVSGPLDAVHEMREAFLRRGKMMHELLNQIEGVTCLEPQGAFYAFPSFEGVLGREVGGRKIDTTLDLADVLLDESEVALVPGEAFDAPGYMRLSFALGDDDIAEGLQRIAKLLV